MQIIGGPTQSPVQLPPGSTKAAGPVPAPAGVTQAHAGIAELLASLRSITSQVSRLAAALGPPVPSPRRDTRSTFVDPRVSDAKARANEQVRQDGRRIVATEARGHTLRQVADRNLALQGWRDASNKQVAQETKRLGALNGITKDGTKLKGHVVVSDNGMRSAEARKVRTRLDRADAKATRPDGAHQPHGGSGKQARAKPATKAPSTTTGGGDIAASAKLTVKGRRISPDQRRNLDAVLDVGKRMRANDKVQRAAVATVIQESNAQNLNHGDRDSLGLFQQRPSMGWGSPSQVRDPEHAARKFYEQAIPSDRKGSKQSIAQLAQSVQRSGFPGAYSQWKGEAHKIVAAWKSGD